MKSLCWGIIFLSTFVFAGDLASDYKEFEKKISEEKELQFFSFFEMPNLIVGSGIKSKLSCDEIRKNEKKQRGEPVKVKDNLISK